MIKKLKGTKINYPCSPCEWISDIKYEKISVLLITYGGGMGGANKTEYVKRIDNIKENTIQSFIRTNGKEIKYNTAYIVSIENFTLISVDYKTENPHLKTYGTLKFLIEDNTKVECVNEY